MLEILIDPNVRVENNETFSGFEDVIGERLPVVGERVRVREPESNIVGEGSVTAVHEDDRLIYLAIEWSALMPDAPPTVEELMQILRAAAVTPRRTPGVAPALTAASSGAAGGWAWNRDVALTA